MFRLQGRSALDTIKRIVLFIITLALTFFVIFFLWIPLLILVCIFLLIAFIFRKRINISTFNSFSSKKDQYATWNTDKDTADSNSQDEYKNSECVNADYINLDKEDDT
ncbi:MAG: hypothetical protein K9M56_05755 [Victivallales bacterium]|nr:hypothetical protein [Victivallales bacterium]